jgi:pimeloyl-ACP methyl ester carboxylesterase
MAAATQAAIARGGVAAAQALTLEEPLLQPALREAAVRQALTKQVRAYSGWHWLHHDPVIAPQPPAYTRLEEVSSPTLVITGEHDQRDIHGIAAALASCIPGAEALVVPGAAHMVNLEAPDEFNVAVLGFLEGLEAE